MLPLLMVLAGCGGKIVETAPMTEGSIAPPAATRDPNVQQPPVPMTPPAFAEPASTTPAGACEVLCERDERCDTTLPALPVREGESGDCTSRCEARLAEKTKCSMDEWLLCYAASVQPNACTPLPDECRPAFCAWAWCSKQPVSNCE